MYSAEVLSQLRSLNWLIQEARRVPAESPEGAHIRQQMEFLRGRLPNSILLYHDRLAASGRSSTAEVRQSTCRACHLKVPRSIEGEVSISGRFAVCPNCGVFLWSAEQPEALVSAKPVAKKSAARKALHPAVAT